MGDANDIFSVPVGVYTPEFVSAFELISGLISILISSHFIAEISRNQRLF
jgi:hypothetical protein